MIRFGSVCSGIEAASVSFEPLGWKAAWFSEIDPFACKVLKHHWPETPNLGDMTLIAKLVRAGLVEAPDVFCGGTPCFTAGHLVLSSKGYVPIESIQVGDSVVTHKGRLRRVIRIGSKIADVGILTGVGMTEPITCTPDHPFLSVQWRNQNTRRNNQYAKVEHCGEPEWVAAKDLSGRQWCQLTGYSPELTDVLSSKFDAKTAMYVAGMYLGDGWIRKHESQRKKSVCLGLCPAKLEKLKVVIGDAVVTVTEERTTVRAVIHDTALAEWLLANFGHYSHLKTVPSWVLGHEHRADFLRGFLDTDGCVYASGNISISTTSRSLAYGISDLLAVEGHSSSVAFVKTADTCVIEGRSVNQRDYFQVRAFPLETSRKSRVRHGMILRRVTGYQPKAESEMVYNIEVDDDHSYLVQGAVVHNCQAFSIAGNRNSLDDERGNLSLVFCEIADAIDDIRRARSEPASVIFWENVDGILGTWDNAFGCFLAELAGNASPLEPGPRPLQGRASEHWGWDKDSGVHVPKWSNAGIAIGPKRAVAWRVLDAQFFGLPQRRRRVFVVASAREGFNPAEVLLEFEGVRRDIEPSREPREAITSHSRSGASACEGREEVGLSIEAFRMVAFGEYADDGTASTMKARDYKDATDLAVHVVRDEGRVIPYSLTFCDANGRRADRPNGGLYVTENPDTAPTLTLAESSVKVVHDYPELDTQVRRLTPVECARLQGFPDLHCLIPIEASRKIEADMLTYLQLHRPELTLEQARTLAADAPQYKAYGNSWAVHVIRWIGARVDKKLRELDSAP